MITPENVERANVLLAEAETLAKLAHGADRQSRDHRETARFLALQAEEKRADARKLLFEHVPMTSTWDIGT